MHLSRLLLLTLPLVRAQAVTLPCRCGHVTFAHEHYRAGRDCALCDCAKFQMVRPTLARSRPHEQSGSVA